ncbi:MAG: HEAT repeat domain-containing protein [Chloroflexota bacterium]|nr:MAG: HEAT repeat domain-containing protein [Chloroflexota bacterium]
MERLSHAVLAKLSGLSGPKLDEFATVWQTLPVEERRRASRALRDMAEENIEFEFGSVFSLILSDEDSEVRSSAIEGLWEDDRSSTADRLIALANADPAVTVRADAIAALGRFVQRVALGELSNRVSERIRSAILRLVDDEHPLPVRRRAIEAVGYLGDSDAIAICRRAYASTDAGTRASAIRAIGRTCDPIWIDIIIRELGSDDPEMRFEAAQAAGEIEDSRALPALLAAVRDEDPEVRLAVIAALGAIGGQEARQTLQSVARGKDPALVEAATAALGELDVVGDPVGLRVHDINPN